MNRIKTKERQRFQDNNFFENNFSSSQFITPERLSQR